MGTKHHKYGLLGPLGSYSPATNLHCCTRILSPSLGHFQGGGYRYRSLVEGLYTL